MKLSLMKPDTVIGKSLYNMLRLGIRKVVFKEGLDGHLGDIQQLIRMG